MVKIFKIHKFFGLLAAVPLLILGLTGFILDHDDTRWLYKIRFDHYPKSLQVLDKKLFTAYIKKGETIIVGSKRGLFVSQDNGKHFDQISECIVHTIKPYKSGFLAACDDGIYYLVKEKFFDFRPFALIGKDITSLDVDGVNIVAVEAKKILYIGKQKSFKKYEARMPSNLLDHPITLSRFVRDLHYGRGLISDFSLLINDYGAIVLVWLSLSGFIIYLLLRYIPKRAKKVIKSHANIVAVFAIVPITILSLTGIALDHAKALSKELHSIFIPSFILPPVYHDLHDDIWDVALQNETLYIGNRMGLFATKDFHRYRLISKGFVYKLFKDGNKIIVSGMGAPNRVIQNGKVSILQAPHMFKALVREKNRVHYLTAKTTLPLPKWEDLTLYSVILGLHNGRFFAPWWIWINDLAAISAIILFITGIIRWWRRKRAFKVQRL